MTTRRVHPVVVPLDAIVTVPGSKSLANRALACAAMANGPTTLVNVPDGDDTEAMLECLQVLGVGVQRDDADPAVVHIAGTGGRWLPGPLVLPTRLAGTTSRFMTALAALGPGPYTVDGLPPLRARPMAPLHDALAALGAQLVPGETWGHLPVELRGGVGRDGDGDEPATLAVPGDISSQYLTALMLIAPLLHRGLRIDITTPLVSRPYVEMTAAVMASFGVDGVVIGDDRVTVPAGTYRSCDFDVEPDASSASYPLAAAAVVGGRVAVPGLGSRSMQGDAAFATLLARMGCDVVIDDDRTEVRRTGSLHGIDIDMAEVSDLVPTLAVVAAFADTPTVIRGVGFIRGKESDRIGDLCAELRRAGVDATPNADGITVTPAVPTGAMGSAVVLGTHHDHRLAMAFAVLGLGAQQLGVAGIEVDDPAVVSKSWPAFWQTFEALETGT